MFQAELSKLSGSGTSYTLSDFSYLPSIKSMNIRVQPSVVQKLEQFNHNLQKHFKDFTLSTLESYPQSFLYKELISIFIISPLHYKVFKTAMLKEQYFNHLYVIVFDEDSIEEKHYYNWKATKLVTTDQNAIISFILQLYEYCYYEFLIPTFSSKFTVHNRISTTIYYPHNFDLINKMLLKKQFTEYNITFHPYKKGSEHLVKEQVKKIKTYQRKSGVDSKQTKQAKNRVIVIAAQDSVDQLIGDKEYELVVMRKDLQQQKFVKQFQEVYNTKVEQIQIVSCNTLYLIVPYFDEELREFIGTKYGHVSNLKLLEYSSLTSLKQQISRISYPDVGLIFCDSSFEMITILIKSSSFLKLIVYNFHQKIKLHKMYQRLPTKQDAQIFIDKVVENRIQYRDPSNGFSGCFIYLLINQKEQILIHQISSITCNRNNIELKTFKDTQHLFSLIQNEEENTRILIITRKQTVKQYIKLLAESPASRLLVLTSSHIEYNSLILDAFRKKSDLIRFLMSIIIKVMASNSMGPAKKPYKPKAEQRYSADQIFYRNRLNDLEGISQIGNQQEKSSPRISEMNSVFSQMDNIQQFIQQQSRKPTKNHVIVSKICQLTITVDSKNQTKIQKQSQINNDVLPIHTLDSINSPQQKKANSNYKRSNFTSDQSYKIQQENYYMSTNKGSFASTSSNRFQYPSFSKSTGRNLSIGGYDHVHIYFQKNLPPDILQFILDRCEASSRFIPHQLINYLQLVRNTRTYTSQFFISVLRNSSVVNEISKVLSNNHKIFEVNNYQQVEQFKQLIYQLSESRVNNSKCIQNKLSRIECERMINILNPQERIDPSVFSNMEFAQSEQYIEKQEVVMYSEQQLQAKIQELLKRYSSLKLLVPSYCYPEFQSSVLYLQRFKFQVYSDETQLSSIISFANDPIIILVTRSYSVLSEKNVVVALSPYVSDSIPMYHISSIIKLILLLNNENNRPESSSQIYK